MDQLAQIQIIIMPGPSKTVSKRSRIDYPGITGSQWVDVTRKGPSVTNRGARAKDDQVYNQAELPLLPDSLDNSVWS